MKDRPTLESLERDLEDLTVRVEKVEAKSHAPVDFRSVVATQAEAVAKLIEVDPHQWSARPCQTCRAVTALLGRPFGCEARK